MRSEKETKRERRRQTDIRISILHFSEATELDFTFRCMLHITARRASLRTYYNFGDILQKNILATATLFLSLSLSRREIHTQVSTSLRESHSRQPGFSGCPFISKGPFGPSLNNLYSLIPRGIRKVGQLSLPD